MDTMAVDESFGAAVRYDLDGTSWVGDRPGLADRRGRAFDALMRTVPFEQHQRWMYDRKVDEPRLTAEYPDLTIAPIPFLRTIAEALGEHYRVPYDGVWLNLYRDNHDSTGWHGDLVTCKREECIVPVLSLGASRRFLLKPAKGGRSTALTPDAGDLIVMGGRCQRDWRHSVPKQARPAAERISLNFQSTYQLKA